jgi:hypothetical protein
VDAKLLIFVAPIALAACGGSPETHAVIVAPAVATGPASTPTTALLVNECQSRFAQMLADQPVTYNPPELSMVGSVTTVKLTAASSVPPGNYDYVCTFDGSAMVTAGRS